MFVSGRSMALDGVEEKVIVVITTVRILGERRVIVGGCKVLKTYRGLRDRRCWRSDRGRWRSNGLPVELLRVRERERRELQRLSFEDADRFVALFLLDLP